MRRPPKQPSSIDAVGRDLLPRPHDEPVADAQLLDRDADFGTVAQY